MARPSRNPVRAASKLKPFSTEAYSQPNVRKMYASIMLGAPHCQKPHVTLICRDISVNEPVQTDTASALLVAVIKLPVQATTMLL